MNQVIIYALCEPEGQIRYIGKALDPHKRLRNHLKERGKTRRHNWIKHLKSEGRVPVLQIIEICTDENWQERERYWISHYRNLGLDLVNLTQGGDGLVGFRHSPESCARMSATRKGRKPWNLGKKHSEETKRKIREHSVINSGTFKPGYKMSDQMRENIRKGHLGKRWKMSERGRESIRELWRTRRELRAEFWRMVQITSRQDITQNPDYVVI